MLCEVLKTFLLSPDGIAVVTVAAGQSVEIPDGVVPGLEAEGYIRPVSYVTAAEADRYLETRAIAGAPENRALSAAPETSLPVASARRRGRKT